MSEKKWIVILEDDHRRRMEMFRWLDDRLHMFPVVMFRDREGIVDWWAKNPNATLVASLDHDLEDPHGAATPSRQVGNGREVVDWLLADHHGAPFPIVVHSTNDEAAQGMCAAIEAHEWPLGRIRPYDDLRWIGEAWYPQIKSAIQIAARITTSGEKHVATATRSP